MQSYRRLLTAAVILTASTKAMAQTTYNIQRIGLTDPGNAPGLYVGVDASGGSIEQNTLSYANTSGVVIGATVQFNGQSSGGSSASFEYNGTSTVQLGLTSSLYQHKAVAGYAYAGTVNTGLNINYFKDYLNGYVGGTSARYDANNNSEGPDAWISNGTGPSTLIGLPTLATGGSNTTYAGNIAYSYVNPVAASSTFGDTIQSTGTSSALVFATGNGNAAGASLLYYNSGTTAAPVWTAIGNGFSDSDAWYYNGTSNIQIGFISGNNVNSASTTGVTGTTATPFDRASVPVRTTLGGQVFGYSKYYGGSTSLTTSNGQDDWIYDPSNATGTGANGTTLLAPPVSGADVGVNSYTGGNSSLPAPTWGNDVGQFAAAFQKFANGDTARATALAQDAFIYTSSTSTWTQVGLTGPAYTFYQGVGSAANLKSGFGGSNIGISGSPVFIATYQNQYPAINNAGQVVGFTKRTAANVAAGGVYIGEDAWVYYPPGAVPTGGHVGTTQIGLTGGVYETTTSNGVNRASLAEALSTNGAVAGVSQRYQTATATTSAGLDAWYYDPAHGITTTTMVGLTGPNYEFTPAGATNNFRNSTITAINNAGMVGGYTYRNPSGLFSSSTSGYDAWVFSSSTQKTYNVDPNTASTTNTSPVFVYSTISYISDTGVALGYDYSQATNGSGPPPLDKLFEWYLAYDSGSGLYDIPTFQYMTSAVNPASLAAGNWQQLYTTLSFSSMTASGNIVGLGGLSTEDGSSFVPFVLTPAVPEPASLSMLGAGGLMLLARRRRNA